MLRWRRVIGVAKMHFCAFFASSSSVHCAWCIVKFAWRDTQCFKICKKFKFCYAIGFWPRVVIRVYSWLFIFHFSYIFLPSPLMLTLSFPLFYFFILLHLCVSEEYWFLWMIYLCNVWIIKMIIESYHSWSWTEICFSVLFKY